MINARQLQPLSDLRALTSLDYRLAPLSFEPFAMPAFITALTQLQVTACHTVWGDHLGICI